MPFGQVVSVSIIKDKYSGQSRGFGFALGHFRRNFNNILLLIRHVHPGFIEPAVRKARIQLHIHQARMLPSM
jgi:hypothetical protein